MFHPAVGPEAEAETLYVRQLSLRERLVHASGPLVIWDVGLGAAGNALAAMHALSAHAGTLVVESFDRSLAALQFALSRLDELPALRLCEGPLRQLAVESQASWQIGSLQICWRVHLGDFPRLLEQPAATQWAKPHAIFWDPHSPARNPEMWTLSVFQALFQQLDPRRPCALATYSRSTLVRTALLLAGFHVGVGFGVGAKEETTVAANCPTLLASPLTRAWLRRVQRSGSAEPLRQAAYTQRPLDPATWSDLVGHAQFATQAPPPI